MRRGRGPPRQAAEVEGRVVSGDQRGGTLGFPTANIAVEPGSAGACARDLCGRGLGGARQRARSASIRTTAGPSAGSRPFSSTSRAICTAKSSDSSSGAAPRRTSVRERGRARSPDRRRRRGARAASFDRVKRKFSPVLGVFRKAMNWLSRRFFGSLPRLWHVYAKPTSLGHRRVQPRLSQVRLRGLGAADEDKLEVMKRARLRSVADLPLRRF